jgi:colanic acid/amylovoran biosynthesis glycosyltransferase
VPLCNLLERVREVAKPGIINVVFSCGDWLLPTQTWIYNQYRYLPPDRVRVHVACQRTENLDRFPAPDLYVLGERRSLRFLLDRLPKKLGLWSHSRFLVGVARRVGATVVHSHFGPCGWSEIASVRHIPARHIVTFYGFDMSRLPAVKPVWKDRYKELFATADRVLCEGPFMGEAIVQLGCPRKKIRIHHLGIEVERIAFSPRMWTAGLPLRVLIAATFTEKKGIPDALEALGRIAAETKIEITIIGDARPNDPDDRRELDRIRRTIDTSGLSENVRFLGYQPHARLMEEAYRHHIFLSPSVTAVNGDTEGGVPVTLIEMAATGMPVVSTYHCDIPNVITSNRAGLLANEHDVVQLGEHLTWLIRNPDAWHDMVTAARQHIGVEFNAETQGARLASIYEETLCGSCQ